MARVGRTVARFLTPWNGFNLNSHMEKVEPGDAIFMYAKGVGIIGIGHARAKRKILKPTAPGRIGVSPDFPDQSGQDEWRVPVDWLAWCDDKHAYPYNMPRRWTFLNVTGDNYHGLREGIAKHFSGSS